MSCVSIGKTCLVSGREPNDGMWVPGTCLPSRGGPGSPVVPMGYPKHTLLSHLTPFSKCSQGLSLANSKSALAETGVSAVLGICDWFHGSSNVL